VIVIELDKKDRKYAEAIIAACEEENITTIEQKSVLGTEDLIKIALVLSPVVVPAVVQVITEIVKKNVRITITTPKGRVENITEKNAMKILPQLLEGESAEEE